MGALIVNGSRRNKQSLLRIFHRCFLPSFVSFGQAVSSIYGFWLPLWYLQTRLMLWVCLSFISRHNGLHSTYCLVLLLLFQSYWVFRICSVSSAFLDRNIGIVFGIELLHLIQTMFSASTTGSFTPLHAKWRLLISSQSVGKHGHHMQFLFLIGRFLKKSSPLKPLGQMNRNMVGGIYGRFSVKIATDRDKMRILYREPSIDASCQISVHLAKWL
jgi:hypothetical protein